MRDLTPREAAAFHLLCAVAVGLSWARGESADAVFVALMWGAVVLGCRMLGRAGARGRAAITAHYNGRRAMIEQPPLFALSGVINADSEWPALILCLEAGTGDRDCGAWAKVHDAGGAEAWVADHARAYHEARAIRFEVWRRRPDALDAVIQPPDTPPTTDTWNEGPYEPPTQ